MSTKFTNELSDETPFGLSLIEANQWFSQNLLSLMHARGHTQLSSGHLSFFACLDCGITHASAAARRLGISRQAVYKTTKELQALGILELQEAPDDGRQKVIAMKPLGETIALDARSCLKEIEVHLRDKIGSERLEHLKHSLTEDWGIVSSKR